MPLADLASDIEYMSELIPLQCSQQTILRQKRQNLQACKWLMQKMEDCSFALSAVRSDIKIALSLHLANLACARWHGHQRQPHGHWTVTCKGTNESWQDRDKQFGYPIGFGKPSMQNLRSAFAAELSRWYGC